MSKPMLRLVWCASKTRRSTEKLEELLQPLLVLEKPWVSSSMDFIYGLPKVTSMSSIIVVFDRFAKYAVFIPAPHACPTDVPTDLFYKYVMKWIVGGYCK